MENVNYIGLSHQLALRRHMDIIANNIANTNTTGFRGEKPLFEEFLIATTQPLKASFVSDFGTLRSLDAGPIETTGNPLDVALGSPGYFVVDTVAGERYTRNGSFRLDSDGQLVTAQGDPVLDDGGQPIVIDPSQGRITITREGVIANPFGPIGRIQVVQFNNEQRLQKVANSPLLIRGPARALRIGTGHAGHDREVERPANRRDDTHDPGHAQLHRHQEHARFAAPTTTERHRAPGPHPDNVR